MRIELEIPKEFEEDYANDKFKEFFSRVLCDIDRKGACGLYEEEIAEMFIYAFDNSKLAYNTDKVVEELRTNSICKSCLNNKNSLSICGDFCDFAKRLMIVKAGGVNGNE